ncbi:MAG: porin [Cytophagaceae bacterium]|nr:MAG: porin [Cytophagaceae bacterium]
MSKLLYTLALSATCLVAHAQTDSTDTGKLTVSGYIDSYYLTAFNRPKSGNLLGADQLAGRAFDRLPDQFALGLVQAKLAYSNKKSDLVIDLTFGPNADLGNFGNTTGALNLYRPASPYVAALYGTSAAIKQAYFTYRIVPKLSVTVGQFGTHIGYEVIDAPLNYNYSLSNLFNNGPFYHIGLKAAYAFNDKTSLMLGVVNNWDNLTDNNKQKSLIGQFAFKPLNTWAVYVNWIGGFGDDAYISTLVDAGTLPTASNNYQRNLFDLTTTYQVTPKFYLGLNAAYGWYNFKDPNAEQAISTLFGSTSPNWGGVALYSNYAFTDVVGLGVRYEYFNDKHGVRYLHTSNNSLTVTAPITLAAGKLQVKPEFRLDVAPSAYYENSLGAGTSQQSTLGVAFIYKY